MVLRVGATKNRARRGRRGEQLLLPTHRRGGRRPGAGRPRLPGSRVAHRRREKLSAYHPVHVTLRVIAGLPSLRHRRLRKAIFAAIAQGSERFGFRLVHFSIQSNHVHLVCEGDDERALSRGMQGLGIRIAKAINRKLGRSGSLFAHRYHARALRTPREVRNALAYAINNARKHGLKAPPRWIDPCSSGLLFDGWCTGVLQSDDGALTALFANGWPITAAARSWLLTKGWRRYGPLRPDELSPSVRTPFFEPE